MKVKEATSAKLQAASCKRQAASLTSSKL